MTISNSRFILTIDQPLATTVEYLQLPDIIRFAAISQCFRSAIQTLLESDTFGWSFENKERFISLKLISSHWREGTGCFGFHPFKTRSSTRSLVPINAFQHMSDIWYNGSIKKKVGFSFVKNKESFASLVLRPFLENTLNSGTPVSKSQPKQAVIQHWCREIVEISLSTNEDLHEIGDLLLDTLRTESWSQQKALIETAKAISSLFGCAGSLACVYSQSNPQGKEKLQTRISSMIQRLLNAGEIDEQTRSAAVKAIAQSGRLVAQPLIQILLQSGSITQKTREESLQAAANHARYITTVLDRRPAAQVIPMLLDLGPISEKARDQTLTIVQSWEPSEHKDLALKALQDCKRLQEEES